MVGGYSSFVVTLLFVGMNFGSLLVGAIPCPDAIARMLPCQGFLIGVGDISVACCQSCQSLSQIVNTNPQYRTSICQCLKQAANVIGINMERAQQIPQLCHIDLASGFIDPNVDCNKLSAPSPRINTSGQIAPSDSGYSPQIWSPIIAPTPNSPQI